MSTGATPDGNSDAPPWHAMRVEEVAKRLATNAEKGLDAAEATTRLQKYGPNRLPEGKKRGPFMRFLTQFNNILVYVLLGAGFTKLMLSLWVDAAIIFAVIVLNGLLGFIQEGRAEKALDSIHRYVIELGHTLEPLSEAAHNEINKVRGCVSQVWLEREDRTSASGQTILHYRGDSNSHLVRGLIAISMALFSDRAPKQFSPSTHWARLARSSRRCR